MRFYRNVFRLSYACHTFLSKCLACGSIQMSCVRSAPVIRSSRNVLRSITPAVCRLCAKQDGLRDVPFLFRRGSGSLFARSRMSCGYRALLVHFGLVRFFMAIPTENERERGRRRTESAARQSAFLRDRISFAMFSAGSPLGAARPQTCAKESSTLWTLFTLRRGWGGADSRRRHPGTRKAPPGSDKRRPHCGWPGGSGCILLTFLALRGSKWNRPAGEPPGGSGAESGCNARSEVRAGSACRP